ncbi:MAG: TetR/AcrR family transcriptional regulator [Myxococcales bacterium]|nr:TetR/AcrR family transcriptional regulator [Myxococcales bacterium]MCB9715942.1 TetR/AcrR family transcriptional regulator [Myxococcales bacterium]
MPRAHTPEEIERIRERLLQAGREGFPRVGLAKLTIADLAREAGIGKGSFYRFYDSKEELFLAIQEEEEARFKAALLEEVARASDGRKALTTLMLATATRLDDHPFLRLLLDPSTLGELTLRMPPERLAAHRENDRDFFVSLVHEWKQRGWLRPELDPNLAFDVLTAVFVVSVQRELIGEETSRRATAELADALADRWCP